MEPLDSTGTSGAWSTTIDTKEAVSEKGPASPPAVAAANSSNRDYEVETARITMLKARYGHVQPGAQHGNLLQYFLHFKVTERAVNQGLCFFNSDLNTYYLKSRKACPADQVPKELVAMDLERATINQGHTHVSFYVTGTRFSIYKIRYPYIFHIVILGDHRIISC